MADDDIQSSPSPVRSKADLDTAHMYFSMVKRRVLYLDKHLSLGTPSHIAMDHLVTLEYVYLHIRKIIEELMLMSVAANALAGAEISRAIREEWNAHRIMAKLAKINPAFFPESLAIGPSDEPGISGKFLPPSGDNLTKDQAAEIYGVCGSVLHAGPKNFERDVAIGRFNEASIFLRRIKSLLEQFLIDISGHSYMVMGRLDLEEDAPPTLYIAGLVR